MKLSKPRIDKELLNPFTLVPGEENDDVLRNILVKDVQHTEDEFRLLDVSGSVFSDCSFFECDFTQSTFHEVVFENCDFSNCCFDAAYFDRCYFTECKAVGLKSQESCFKQTQIIDSVLRYAAFDQVKFDHCAFERVDLSNATITSSELIDLAVDECRLVENDFFKTSLKGLDVSTCEFTSPLVSSPPYELKGLVIDRLQAAHLVEFLDVKIKE